MVYNWLSGFRDVRNFLNLRVQGQTSDNAMVLHDLI